MSKANVIGTAVGSYLIRKTDPKDGTPPSAESKSIPRTFATSEVRPYSWPCIIVLVRKWLQEGDFGPKGEAKSWDILPKALYLADGRAVPVCTVLAEPVPASEKAGGNGPLLRPNATYGGGMPMRVNVQGEDRFGTTGCLVSDGHLTYALTARHVCGEAETEISVEMRNGIQRVGTSAKVQLTRLLFSDVYPAFPMRQTWLSIDAGLVTGTCLLEDCFDCVFGLGLFEVGETVEATEGDEVQ